MCVLYTINDIFCDHTKVNQANLTLVLVNLGQSGMKTSPRGFEKFDFNFNPCASLQHYIMGLVSTAHPGAQ